jgi:hypothetical protein
VKNSLLEGGHLHEKRRENSPLEKSGDNYGIFYNIVHGNAPVYLQLKFITQNIIAQVNLHNARDIPSDIFSLHQISSFPCPI